MSISSIDSSMMSGMSGMTPPPHGGPRGGSMPDSMLEQIAERTGLTVDELKASEKDGSLMEVLQEAGITQEDMEEMRTAAIQADVEAGIITAEQAEEMLSKEPPPPPPSGMMGGMMGGTENESILEQLKEYAAEGDTDSIMELLQSLIDQEDENSTSGGSLFNYLT